MSKGAISPLSARKYVPRVGLFFRMDGSRLKKQIVLFRSFSNVTKTASYTISIRAFHVNRSVDVDVDVDADLRYFELYLS